MEVREFHDRVCRSLGPNLMTMNRPAIPEMRKTGATSVDLRYQEISNFEPICHEEIEHYDGEEWITISLMKQG